MTDSSAQGNTKQKREAMTKESWIRNVLRIFPHKTKEEAEQLHDKIFSNGK